MSSEVIPWHISWQTDSLVTLIGLAFVFASTNIDAVFVLVGFFADKNFRADDVVIGRYAGITALYVISAIAALISVVIPPVYIGLLGLVPMVIGIKKLYYLWRNRSVYRSLRYARSFEVPVMGIEFAVMTGLWCLAVHCLVNHRALGVPIRAQAHGVVPFVLIGLGILIFIRTDTIQLSN